MLWSPPRSFLEWVGGVPAVLDRDPALSVVTSVRTTGLMSVPFGPSIAPGEHAAPRPRRGDHGASQGGPRSSGVTTLAQIPGTTKEVTDVGGCSRELPAFTPEVYLATASLSRLPGLLLSTIRCCAAESGVSP